MLLKKIIFNFRKKEVFNSYFLVKRPLYLLFFLSIDYELFQSIFLYADTKFGFSYYHQFNFLISIDDIHPLSIAHK